MSPILFLHVPKTAGTSFCSAAVAALGNDRCLRDYGPDTEQTSALIRELVYKDRDLHRLGCALRERGIAMLAGHFTLRKYVALFGAESVVAFFRHPAAHVISHYEHFVRHNGFTGTLGDFVSSPSGWGIQKKYSDGLPLEIFGCIGITEHYQESLTAFEAIHGIAVQNRRLNANPERENGQGYQIPASHADAYQAAVEEDLPTYVKALEIFERRRLVINAGQPLVHGLIQVARPDWLAGLAFRPGSDQPVVLEVEADGRSVAQVRCVKDRPMFRGVVRTRNGYIGFDLRRPRLFKPGQHVQLRDTATGQVVGESACSAPEPGCEGLH